MRCGGHSDIGNTEALYRHGEIVKTFAMNARGDFGAESTGDVGLMNDQQV